MKMLLGTPTTWFIHDVLVTLMYAACVVHAARSANPALRVMMLLGFTLFTGVFENIGVVVTGNYFYSDARLAMVSHVPLGVLLLETVIFYAVITLLERLRVPGWAMPFAAGFLTTLQDLSIDPTAVHDRYLINGSLSGQWTWVQHYAGTYFGIPFSNFTGWYGFTLAYLVAYQCIVWAYRRFAIEHKALALWALPFLSTLGGVIVLLIPVTAFMIDLRPFVSPHTRWAELTMLIINMVIGLGILLRTVRLDGSFDFQRDGFIIFAILLLLHAYDIIVAFARGITIAYVPSLGITAFHVALFVTLFVLARRRDPKHRAMPRPIRSQ
jgi:uncharacterized membrane protein